MLSLCDIEKVFKNGFWDIVDKCLPELDEDELDNAFTTTQSVKLISKGYPATRWEPAEAPEYEVKGYEDYLNNIYSYVLKTVESYLKDNLSEEAKMALNNEVDEYFSDFILNYEEYELKAIDRYTDGEYSRLWYVA